MSTVLITGASSGFGLACAEKFAVAGNKLILAARREDRLDALASQLSERAEDFQHVDILINNAGLAKGLGGADVADLDDWEQMVDTNVKGLMYVTRAVLPGMVARGGGHIVNLGSVAASWPYPGGNTYGGTKAFVQQFSRNLRTDLSGKNIRISNIEPGMCETEFSLVRFNGDQRQADQVYAGMKPLSAGDIAEIIYWVTALPPHINVNQMEVMPTAQSWSPFTVHREA